MSIIGESLGVLAGIGSAIVFLPQAIKTISTRDTKGLSLSSYLIYCITMLLWASYGVYLGSLQMMIFNGISFVVTLPILWIIIQNKQK